MNGSLVSVIVPAYNAGETIEKCIQSIIHQTYLNIELLIIDDGSSDNTKKICEENANLDSRIKVVSQKNAGASAARNRGLDISNGEYVLFVDSDDWIEKECIEYAVATIQDTSADLVLWNLVKEYHGISKKHTPIKGDNRSFIGEDIDDLLKMAISSKTENPGMLNLSITGPVCKLFKKKLINSIRFNEKLSIGEDFVFLIDSLSFVNKIQYIDKYFYHVISRENSLSSRVDHSFSVRKTMYVNAMIERLQRNKKLEEALNMLLFSNYLTVIERYLFFCDNMTYKEKKNCILYFNKNIVRKIDYAKVKHKCKYFIKYKFFLPIYFIGKVTKYRG